MEKQTLKSTGLTAGARRMAMVLFLIFMVSAARGQSKEQREYAIKAAFLYNFCSYIDWPAEAQTQNPSAFVIGIVGGDPFGGALDTIRGKMVKGKRIEVRPVESMEQVGECHMIFVCESHDSKLQQVLAQTKNSPVLTVGETSEFLREGGVINLISSRNRVQIEINPNAAERAGLTISSQLLKLAQIVRG